jgi:DNA-binding MarR family transcriptional regulator
MNNSLSEKLLQRIYNFTNLTQRQYHQEHHQEHPKTNDSNIGHGQGHLLGILLKHDGLTQKELSTQLQIRPASLGELVDKLESSGYVERRVNEKDKRVSNVYLKDEGRKLVKEIVKSRNSAVDKIFSCLSEEEKNQLSALMGKLVDSLKENSTDNNFGFEKRDMDLIRKNR